MRERVLGWFGVRCGEVVVVWVVVDGAGCGGWRTIVTGLLGLV